MNDLTGVKFSEEIISALKGSVEKWRKIADNEGDDKGAYNCPLCALCVDSDCFDCPVRSKIGNRGCLHTPFEEWRRHFDDKHSYVKPPFKLICHECKRLAEKERDFLQSLLDEIQPKPKEKYYLKIANSETAIGDDDIDIEIVDRKGDRILCGSLVSLSKDGVINRKTCVASGVGLKLDADNRIKFDD